MLSIDYFDKICRVCLTSKNLRDIFTYHEEKNICSDEDHGTQLLELSVKMMACYNFKIAPGDGLPSKICESCIDLLNAAFRFKKLCERNDFKLRNIANLQLESEIMLTNEKVLILESNDITPHLNKENNNSITNVNNLDSLHFKCSICEKEFSTFKLRQRHLSSNHRLKLKCFKCYFCDKIFRTRSNRAAHEKAYCRIAASDKVYKCRNCSEFYSDRKDFDAHIRSHLISTPVGPQSCRVCNKVLSSHRMLQQHSRLHETHMKHMCHVCGRMFARSDYLASHARVHAGDHQHTCHLCTYSCVQRSALLTHLRRHLPIATASTQKEIKPQLQCLQCDKTYRSKSSLSKHLQITHDEPKPYHCCRCNNTYSHKRGLRRHELLHHLINKSIISSTKKSSSNN